MKVYFRKLPEALNGPLRPVYLVTGDEPVQTRDAAALIRRRARREGFERRELRVIQRDFDWSEVAALCSPSLFGERSMLDLRLMSGRLDVGSKSQLKKWCEHAPADSLVLLQMPRLDNRALNEAWARAVDQVGVIVRIMPMDETEMSRWLLATLSRQQLRMGQAETAFFLSCVEGNLLAAEQEIDKLRILLGPGEVSMERLQQMLQQDARHEVMDLGLAMLQGRPRRIVQIARNLRSEGEDPVAVHAMLIREVRSVLTLQQAPSGLNTVYPLIRRKALERAVRDHSRRYLRGVLQCFIDLERTLKGRGPRNPWDALEDACLSFSGQAPTQPWGVL